MSRDSLGGGRVSEPTVNAVLAEMLSEKLNEWFEKILPGALEKYRGRRRAELDVALTELFGVKIGIEAKLGYSKIDKAKEQCVTRLKEGLVDICFAVAYSDELKNAYNIEEIKDMLSNKKLRVIVLSPYGREIDLGNVNLDELITTLDKHRIYHEVVKREVVEEIAEEIKTVLDSVKNIHANILKSMAQLIEKDFKIHGGGTAEEDEDGEE